MFPFHLDGTIEKYNAFALKPLFKALNLISFEISSKVAGNCRKIKNNTPNFIR